MVMPNYFPASALAPQTASYIASDEPLKWFYKGREEREKDDQRNLLREVGGLAASGNISGATQAAMRGGEIRAGMDISNWDTERRTKAVGMLFEGAQRADTPEKWAALVNTAERTFGPEMVANYRDFRARPNALTALERAKLQVEQARARAANAEAATHEREAAMHSAIMGPVIGRLTGAAPPVLPTTAPVEQDPFTPVPAGGGAGAFATQGLAPPVSPPAIRPPLPTPAGAPVSPASPPLAAPRPAPSALPVGPPPGQGPPPPAQPTLTPSAPPQTRPSDVPGIVLGDGDTAAPPAASMPASSVPSSAPQAPRAPRTGLQVLGDRIADAVAQMPEAQQAQFMLNYMDKSTRKEAWKMLGGGEGLNPRQRAETEESLRKEYSNLAKPYFEMRDAITRIDASAPGPAGDLSLIYNFMKMLDPGSVVREGEFAMIGRSGGLPTQVQGIFNRLIGQGQLTSEQRQEIKGQSRALLTAQERQYNAIQSQYGTIADRIGLDRRNIIIDFSRPGVPTTDDRPPPFTNPTTSQPTQQGAAPPVAGARQAPDGNWYVPDPQRPGKYLRVDS